MFRDLGRAFAGLFTERRSQVWVTLLLLAMAAIPVAELGVIRTFSELVIDGPSRFDTDRTAVLGEAAVFFAGFALTRGLHHLVRFWRVRVFRKGFETSGLQRTHGEASWEWAQGFELSTITVGLIQVVTFSALFGWLDPIVGAVNAVVCAGALAVVAGLYRHQLARQAGFADEGARPGSTAISVRIATRVFAAEFGSVVATTSMALMMVVVLWRSLSGGLSGADAVVLFLGLRLLYGHLGALAPSVMRFARDSVRRRVAQSRVAAAAAKAVADAPAVTDRAPRPVRIPPKRRTQVLTHLVMAGQRGDLSEVRSLSDQLMQQDDLSDRELRAVQAAGAFAAYASADTTDGPLTVMWWPRPFPGNFGDWLSPFLLRAVSGRRVLFQPPTAATTVPNLVTIGSIGRFVQPRSIVVGTGISRSDATMPLAATVLSVRGPLTAAAVRRGGGPDLDSFGDPGLLLSRLLPVPRAETNGRLALVRHHAHAALPVELPADMDELSVLVSHPDDIVEFVGALAGYDGVVTSAMHVLIACHSYGIPCELVTFRGFEGAVHGDASKYRDYALGASLADEWTPEPTGTDLRRVQWRERLRVATVPDWKLDEIESALRRGVKEYDAALARDEAAADELDAIEDDDDDGW